MIALASGILAVLLYLTGTLLQKQALGSNTPAHTGQGPWPGSGRILLLAVIALVIHMVNVLQIVATGSGYDFSFFKIATLFSWVMVLIVVISSIKLPLQNLFLVLFPLAIVSILCSVFLPSESAPVTDINAGVALHILLGILAFSVITIAAVQAVLVAWLSRELKQHHFNSVLRHLPPLQTLEVLLFDFIKAGFLMLVGVIVSGFLFMEDMFAQHLVHKTVLTIVSTCVFGVLLWGRIARGWRGKVALRWTLSGFAVLILAYFGSKFVLELLLHRT
jgi:ABC-type uncharacterized transport system permease subunit